jgi:hypothetical protein
MKQVFQGKTRITACSNCGGEEFGVVVRFSGQSEYNYRLKDGEVGDNTGLHDGVNYREQKKAFCSDCKTPLGVVKEITQD